MNSTKSQIVAPHAENRALEPVNVIIYLIATLLVVGIIMVYSTSSAKFLNGESTHNLVFIKHILWVTFAFLGMLIMMRIEYHFWQKYSNVIFGIAIICLVAVLIPGVGSVINGARRWIRFSSYFGVQPSEFAKLAMIIFVSSYVAKNQDKMQDFVKGFVFPLVIIGGVSLLVLIEPDFGTTLFIMFISLILMIVGGTRIVYFIFILMAAVPFIYESIHKIKPYQMKRIMVFLDPWRDPQGDGYQIVQSWITLGSGGVSGLGLGEGRQKLFFLPVSNSDFIFSVIGEEFGFIGTSSVIIMFALLSWYGIKVSKLAPDMFGSLLALGITLAIALQSAMNIAVVTGAIPTTGIPLPFISTGGSSLFLSLLGMGILLSIAKQSKS
ncbi:MAG: stage V sporulation protein E [Candidatus Scalindua sp.]|nr:putative lipid II flippase FtsW [Planctomycetota bacterium]GJQ57294.1 MAG: stage V sporulation protein E [Candidatus Scalindua sp.]